MKKFLTWVSLAVFLVAGVYASVTLAAMPRSYDGRQMESSVYELLHEADKGESGAFAQETPKADGAAAAIVQENLKSARALNDVASVVYDFRGYDTMGEAFILVTSVAGILVILFNKKEEKEDVQT